MICSIRSQVCARLISKILSAFITAEQNGENLQDKITARQLVWDNDILFV
jgi:hypothetical protein